MGEWTKTLDDARSEFASAERRVAEAQALFDAVGDREALQALRSAEADRDEARAFLERAERLAAEEEARAAKAHRAALEAEREALLAALERPAIMPLVAPFEAEEERLIRALVEVLGKRWALADEMRAKVSRLIGIEQELGIVRSRGPQPGPDGRYRLPAQLPEPTNNCLSAYALSERLKEEAQKLKPRLRGRMRDLAEAMKHY